MESESSPVGNRVTSEPADVKGSLSRPLIQGALGRSEKWNTDRPNMEGSHKYKRVWSKTGLCFANAEPWRDRYESLPSRPDMGRKQPRGRRAGIDTALNMCIS